MQQTDNGSRPAIEIDHVGKIYKLYNRPSDRLRESLGLTRKKLSREHHALSDVSFEVKKGETVGIIGTNGAGKSTLLKIITGVVSPTAGEVRADGRISALLELGAGFNMEYSGMENIYLNGTMMGFSDDEIESRMDSILSFADIGEFVHQPVKTYSSGMFVRLAFAIAINIDPEILIVDEALSVGDVFFQAKCYRKFEEFKREGKTILFVSHDLSSINRYCDRVVLLDHGTKLAEGSPKEMVDLYKQLIVRKNRAAGSGAGERQTESGRQSGAGKQPGRADHGKSSGSEGQSDHADRSKLAGAAGETDQASGAERGFASGDDGIRWILPGEKNAETLEYGDRRGEMLGYCILDENGVETDVIEKGTRFTIKVRVRFHEPVIQPIFAYTFKDMRGTEITGTNTLFEKIPVPPQKAGDTVVVTYVQQMDLQGGEYLISFGLTGYEDGEFVVYHRLYDVCSITVMSAKNTVGFYDMNSRITVEPEAGR